MTMSIGVRAGVRIFLQNLVLYASIALLLLSLIALFLWDKMIVSINSGEAGVMYKRFQQGTITDKVYHEGIHLVYPWDILYVYNMRVQTIRHSFNVLTNKGLSITLHIAIRFYPEQEMLGVLHQKVGPNYAEKIVVPQVESVLRKNIGGHDPEDIYTNKEGILTAIINLALEEAGRKYVHIDDIIIRSLELPPTVRAAIQEKLVEEQREKTYEFRLRSEEQEAQRKLIEAQGIRRYQEVITETLNDKLITWQAVQATLTLAESQNAKVVVIGSGDKGLPVILNAETHHSAEEPKSPPTSSTATATSPDEPPADLPAPMNSDNALTEPPSEPQAKPQLPTESTNGAK